MANAAVTEAETVQGHEGAEASVQASAAHQRARRLPPLEALRVFEAASRHLSFARAADELCITASAVSHRVAALEQELGVRLFERLPRALALSSHGERLARRVRASLDDLALAVVRLDRDDGANALTISAAPSFASLWLLPRLHGFHALSPNTEVRLLRERQRIDLRRHDAQLAIRFGLGDDRGQAATPLMSDRLFPVCSPRLLGARAVNHVEDLLRWPLLHDLGADCDQSGEDWRSWLRHIGVPVSPKWEEGHRFNEAQLVVEAALSGMGMALARESLVADELARGRLVRPLPHSAPAQFSYFLLESPAARQRQDVACFRRWLLDEVRLFRIHNVAGSSGGGDQLAVPALTDDRTTFRLSLCRDAA